MRDSPTLVLGAAIVALTLTTVFLVGAIASWRGQPGPHSIVARAEQRYREMFTDALVDSYLSAALPLGVSLELVFVPFVFHLVAEAVAPDWSVEGTLAVASSVAIVFGIVAGVIAVTTSAFGFPQFAVPRRFRRHQPTSNRSK